jgi:hypothetical protein
MALGNESSQCWRRIVSKTASTPAAVNSIAPRHRARGSAPWTRSCSFIFRQWENYFLHHRFQRKFYRYFSRGHEVSGNLGLSPRFFLLRMFSLLMDLMVLCGDDAERTDGAGDVGRRDAALA